MPAAATIFAVDVADTEDELVVVVMVVIPDTVKIADVTDTIVVVVAGSTVVETELASEIVLVLIEVVEGMGADEVVASTTALFICTSTL